MGMKDRLTGIVKNTFGDDRFALLRYRNRANAGLREYGEQFEATGGTPRSILTCCPHYGNLGDHAIALAERRMLGRMQRPVLSFGGDTTALLLCLRRYASQEDTIYSPCRSFFRSTLSICLPASTASIIALSPYM